MGWLHYGGSGITSRWVRVFLCLVFIVWGGAIALFSFERTPTRVHGEYIRALHDAEQKGQAPATVPKPPESQMWRDGVPEWTILGVVMAAVGIAALTEPLWRRHCCSNERTENTSRDLKE